MEENLRNKIILALGLLTIIFFISSISSCQNATKLKKLVNQERRVRMELEEKMLNLSNQNADLKQKINQLQETIIQQGTTRQTLNQEISKLKEELKKVTKLKERLEEDLKEVLVSEGER